jgi:protein TonB
MLAYAARRPVFERRPHPNTLLMIIGAHVGLLAAVMSAKMEFAAKPPPVITKVQLIPLPKDPPPHPTKTTQRVPMIDSWIDQPRTQVKIAIPKIDTLPAVDPGTGADDGNAVVLPIPHSLSTTVSSGPLLITSQSELKPPYPASKLLSEEEAVLRLKLTIDEMGRVVAVDPVGRADPAFLDAARRHLIAHWRYKPANQDGHAVSSTAVITLHFELDG